MPDNSRETLARAQIQMLARAAAVAVATSDVKAFDAAEDQLGQISLDIAVPAAVRDVAGDCHDRLAFDMTDAGLATLQGIVAGFANADQALRAAIAVAKAGKGALSIPAAAKAATQALSSFQALQQALAGIQGDLRTAAAAHQIEDVPDKLKQLLANLEALKNCVATA
ncbi:MAG: hypothetical protein PHY45_05315 [Rhodocyclaceae bacterium]|nr:hypothetical protein [Rhodocyclaceae bacterium]